MNFEGETGGAKVIHDDLLTRPRARPRMAELRLTHSRAPGAGQDGLNRLPACDVSQPRRTDAVPGCAYARQTGLRGFAVSSDTGGTPVPLCASTDTGKSWSFRLQGC
jgi:hypothetical protein